MNQTFIKSTLILSVATLVSKILGSIFRIPLQNIAGDEVLGIFTLVYPVYMVALILSVAGIPVAISKLIAEARATNETGKIEDIYRTASILTLLFGLISFTLVWTFADPIARLLGGPSVKPALIIVSLTLLIAPYMAVYRGFFQGFENMVPTAVSQVIEQLVRVTIILVMAFVLVRKNIDSAWISGGIMIGSSLGALASLIYLRRLFKKSTLLERTHTTPAFTWQTFKTTSRTILWISIPISIGAITMALVNVVDSLTIPLSLVRSGVAQEELNYLYGIYGRGLSLVQIVTVFSSSLVLPLIPLITKKLAEKDQQGTQEVIERTHYLSHLISWPAAFGLFALTIPLNIALFKNTAGSDVLAIIGISSVFTSLAILGTGILQGMNRAKQAAYLVLATMLIKAVSNLYFIQQFGLVGAAYATLVVYIILFLANSYILYRYLPYRMWSSKHTRIVCSTLLMTLVIGLPTFYFDVAEWSRKLALLYSSIAIVVGIVVYAISLLVTKAVTKQDLMQLPVVNKLAVKMKD